MIINLVNTKVKVLANNIAAVLEDEGTFDGEIKKEHDSYSSCVFGNYTGEFNFSFKIFKIMAPCTLKITAKGSNTRFCILNSFNKEAVSNKESNIFTDPRDLTGACIDPELLNGNSKEVNVKRGQYLYVAFGYKGHKLNMPDIEATIS